MIRIAVASGKGGTGKTTFATSMVLSLVGLGDIWYLDCDVEAPNGHLFLKPNFDHQTQATIQIPSIQADICNSCGKCVEVCQFHALAKVGKSILVFPQLCHGCGSCFWNCPKSAITETPNSIGILNSGRTKEGIQYSQGQLTISEPMATPIIRQLKKWQHHASEAIVILDAPPGASCSVVEALRHSDFAILVAEPTPFGLHDLKQMLGVVGEMNIPAGIVINRDGIGNDHLEKYLNQNGYTIMMRVPFLKKLAAGLAAGESLVEIMPEYRKDFLNVFDRIRNQINGREK